MANTTELFEHLSDEFGLERDEVIKLIEELDGYGIDNRETFIDAFYGCYDSEKEFTEHIVEECYHDNMTDVPQFITNHIDYQSVWDCELRFDFFRIDDYFFTSNF